jgi:hypothetical protein
MENKMIFREPIDLSGCIREPIDISNMLLTDLLNGNEIKYGQTVKEYYYYSGFTGPTGPTGPSGQSNPIYDTTFLNIYNMDKQIVGQNSSITFNSHNSIFGCCYHEPRTSQIFIWKTGFYHVFTNIYHFEGCQFSLFKNSTEIIPGSTIGTISGTTQNSNTVIIPICANDLIMDCSYSPSGLACSIELVNITPTIDSILLYDSSGLGYVYPQINCSITLFSLSNMLFID